MALLGNYTVLAKNPGKAFSGSTISDNRSQTNKSGAVRGRFTGEANWSPLDGLPHGYRPPYTWLIPIDSGALSTHNIIVGEGALTSAVAGGVNGAALITGSGELTGVGQLVVSAVAAITGSSSVSATVVAVLNAAATLGGTGALTAATIADGYMAATVPGTGTMTVQSYATGVLAAAITPFTELSPESLAQSVWNTVVADQDTDGTTGYALRIAQAVLRNRTVTDPVAGTFTVYDDDNTVLLTGDLWQDADGTTPYTGAGAERRDRLE
jgi:hypothetical protein